MAEFDVQKAIRMVIETGKVEFGTRRGVSLITRGGAKLVFVANNCPKELNGEVTSLCQKSGVPMRVLPFPSMEFGSVCGKPFPVLLMSIIEEGDSDILSKLKEEKKEEKKE